MAQDSAFKIETATLTGINVPAATTIIGSAIVGLDAQKTHLNMEIQNNDAADDLANFFLDVKVLAASTFVNIYSGTAWNTETTRVKVVSDGANLNVLGSGDKAVAQVQIGNVFEIQIRAAAEATKVISELKVLIAIWRL